MNIRIQFIKLDEAIEVLKIPALIILAIGLIPFMLLIGLINGTLAKKMERESD